MGRTGSAGIFTTALSREKFESSAVCSSSIKVSDPSSSNAPWAGENRGAPEFDGRIIGFIGIAPSMLPGVAKRFTGSLVIAEDEAESKVEERLKCGDDDADECGVAQSGREAGRVTPPLPESAAFASRGSQLSETLRPAADSGARGA